MCQLQIALKKLGFSQLPFHPCVSSGCKVTCLRLSSPLRPTKPLGWCRALSGTKIRISASELPRFPGSDQSTLGTRICTLPGTKLGGAAEPRGVVLAAIRDHQLQSSSDHLQCPGMVASREISLALLPRDSLRQHDWCD